MRILPCFQNSIEENYEVFFNLRTRISGVLQRRMGGHHVPSQRDVTRVENEVV